jgi:hypothetical protein
MLALRTAALRRAVVKSSWTVTIALLLASSPGSAAPADHGDAVRQAMERLPAAKLKAFYGSCSQEGIERRLDGADAMACSIGYDVLLNKHFAGDFARFLAWSRAQHSR